MAAQSPKATTPGKRAIPPKSPSNKPASPAPSKAPVPVEESSDELDTESSDSGEIEEVESMDSEDNSVSSESGDSEVSSDSDDEAPAPVKGKQQPATKASPQKQQPAKPAATEQPASKKRKADDGASTTASSSTNNNASTGALDEKRPAKVANTGYTLLVKARALPLEEEIMRQFLGQNLELGEFSLKRSSRFSGGKNEGKDVFELTVPSKEQHGQILASFGQRTETQNQLGGKQIAISEIANCFICGVSGHKANTCKVNLEKKRRRDNKYGPKTTKGARCYNCQQTGHLASTCTNPKVERPEKTVKDVTGVKEATTSEGDAMHVEEKAAKPAPKNNNQSKGGKNEGGALPPIQKKKGEAAPNTNKNNNSNKGSTPKKRIGA